MNTIKTKNLVLDEITPQDKVDLYKIATRINEKANKEESYFHYYAFQPSLVETLTEKIDAFIKANEKTKNTNPRETNRYALRKDNKLIGSVAIDMAPSTSNDQPFYGDLGYFIDPLYAKQGYMTEAIHAILKPFFEKFERLDVTAHPDNIHSSKMLLKMGAIPKTTHYNTKYNNEPRRHFVLHRSDYFNKIQELVKLSRGSEKVRE